MEMATSDQRSQVQGPFKPYATMLEQEMFQAREELERPARGLFLSGLISGFAVGIGGWLAAIVTGLFIGVDSPLLPLVRSAVYSIGFVIAIMGRSDLFTEYSTIAILPVLGGEAKLRDLLRLWVVVYLGNGLGAVILAATSWGLVPASDSLRKEAWAALALPLIEPSWGRILLSGTTAGWLMGLLSWLLVASNETTSRVLLTWITTFAISLAHLHHIVSGLAVVAAAVFMAVPIAGASLAKFIVFTTLGNSLGGISFALLIRYSVLKRTSGPRSERPEPTNS